MKSVVLTRSISGYYMSADGETQAWPTRGNTIELDDALADDMVAGGIAVLPETPEAVEVVEEVKALTTKTTPTPKQS